MTKAAYEQHKAEKVKDKMDKAQREDADKIRRERGEKILDLALDRVERFLEGKAILHILTQPHPTGGTLTTVRMFANEHVVTNEG